MRDFQDALRAKRARNIEVEQQREQEERDRLERERRRHEEQERQRRQQQEERDRRHAELVEAFQSLLSDLQEAFAGSVISRGGWTETGEEFVVKVSTVQMAPRRSLFVELDRDDDEVLVRWTSQVGESIEMWRLAEFTAGMLRTLLLQIVDQELWTGARKPPAFPRRAD